MSVRSVVHVIGLLLVTVALAMLLAAGVSTVYGDGDTVGILLSALVTGAVGLLAAASTSLDDEIGAREGYAIVTLGWAVTAVVGALPYLFTGTAPSVAAAIFESMSGFTTTGATVYAEIERLPHGVLFWRSLTHWLGGMGIIVLAVAVLPYLGVGGMELFRAEVPGPTPERLRPRITQTAKLLWLVYLLLTVVQTVLYLLGGLDLFDAITHTFGTLATGGFSPRNNSIAAFESPYVQYVTIVFMYLAGINFAHHFRALTGRPGVYWRDAEWRFFTTVILAATVVLLVLNLADEGSLGSGWQSVERAVRDSLFQATSIATTTGYVTADYERWAPAAQLLLLALMFVGGMAGSTGGSMKAVRVLIMLKHGANELRKHLHPRAVLLARVGPRVVGEDVLFNVLGFILLYFVLFLVGALVLALLGADLVTSLGASAASLGNVGPGLGAVGPTDHYGWMSRSALAVLTFLMLLGRLEIYTVLLLFHPEMWKGRRLRARAKGLE